MAAIDSDAAAFDRWVAEHGGLVRRVCRSILRDADLGDDAAQETFVRLWRQLTARRRPDSIAGWLRRAAVSASLDQFRRRQVQATATRELQTRADHASRPRGPIDAAADDELRRHYEAALARLPEGQRTVFLLRHEGGLRLSEVAEALGIALPTAKTQFARACVRLQGLLAAFRNDSPRSAPPRTDGDDTQETPR